MLRVFEPQTSAVLLLMFVTCYHLLKGVLALTQTCSTVQLFGGVKNDATKKARHDVLFSDLAFEDIDALRVFTWKGSWIARNLQKLQPRYPRWFI